jgi:hypothetical protein
LADPNPAARGEHAAAAVAIRPIVETRRYSGEEEVPPKAEVMKPIMVEVREAAGEEGVAAEAMTAKTVTAETSAAVAAMSHRAGRHCCGAQNDGRRDRNRTCLPPHASLSFLPSSKDASTAAILEKLRSGDHHTATKVRALPVRIFVARCEEHHVVGIIKREETLKLLMRQFLTDMSVCKREVCASYLLGLVGAADNVSDAAAHPGY